MSLSLLYWTIGLGAAIACALAGAREGEGRMMRALALGALVLAVLMEGGDFLLAGAIGLLAGAEALFGGGSPDRARPAETVRAAAYAAFLVYYINQGGGPGLNVLSLAAQVALGAAGYWWLRRAPAWRDWPAAVKSNWAAIAVSAFAATLAAFGLPGHFWTVAVGAALMCANEMGLLLRRLAPQDPLAMTANAPTILWALEWVGCALIAAGFLLRPA